MSSLPSTGMASRLLLLLLGLPRGASCLPLLLLGERGGWRVGGGRVPRCCRKRTRAAPPAAATVVVRRKSTAAPCGVRRPSPCSRTILGSGMVAFLKDGGKE
jgi:hypothetical protein